MTLKKQGTEFTVPNAQKRYEFDPSVTTLSDGRALVTWTEAGLRLRSGEYNRDVHARILDADGGAVGQEMVISGRRYEQTGSEATGLADGGYVVAWRSQLNESGLSRAFEVNARFYDADGTPIGKPIVVNRSASGAAGEPDLATLADGSVVIVWSDRTGPDADGSGVFLSHFSARGERLADEVLVNVSTVGLQRSGALTAMADGGYAVAWSDTPDRNGDPNGTSVLLQRFSASGERLGAPATIAAGIPANAGPSITTLTDGTLAVGYSVYETGGSMNAFVRHLAADGTPLGAVQAVSPITAGYQLANSVTALDDGGYLFTWTDFVADGSYAAVRAQAFTSDDRPLGRIVQVNTVTEGSQGGAAVARLADGDLLAVWNSDRPIGDGWTDGDIKAQLFGERVRGDAPQVAVEAFAHPWAHHAPFAPELMTSV